MTNGPLLMAAKPQANHVPSITTDHLLSFRAEMMLSVHYLLSGCFVVWVCFPHGREDRLKKIYIHYCLDYTHL